MGASNPLAPLGITVPPPSIVIARICLPVMGHNAGHDSGNAYSEYFESGRYDSRYPAPNINSLKHLCTVLSDLNVTELVDVGAGTGRYVIPVAQRFPRLRIIAVERDSHARQILISRVAEIPALRSISIFDCLPTCNTESGPTVVSSLFGVLSHMSPGECSSFLSWARRRTRDGGALIVSVPNKRRRFLAQQSWHNLRGKAATRITYQRIVGPGRIVVLPYTLHSPTSLASLLQGHSFSVRLLKSESLLAESLVCRSHLLGSIDAQFSGLLPCCLGYGLLACAE
jgi:trans-aconitate methyltransferase